MRVRLGAFLTAVAVSAAVAGAGAAAPDGAAAGCSRAAAAQIATRLGVGVDPTTGKTPIAQVLCGPFLGPGSTAMVASVAIPSCGRSVEWAVFGLDSGEWRLVMDIDHGAFLGVAGSGIREKIGVLSPGDAHCFPSAYRSRIWRWNGSRLAAGPWTLTWALSQFLSADRRLWCLVGEGPGATVYCGSMKPVRSAILRRNGRTQVCEGVGCVQNWNSRARVLRPGRVNELSGFRCVSAAAGVTCTVSVAGTARGHGFRMTRAGVTRIVP